MRLLDRRCAGLDIHKDSISACIRIRVNGKAEAEILEQRFGTFTQQLEQLAAWLKGHKVRQVAMESTGVYWIPAWNVLERAKYGLRLMLVNPAIVRAPQGCKTESHLRAPNRGVSAVRLTARQLHSAQTDSADAGTDADARAYSAGSQPGHQPDRTLAGDGEYQARFRGFQHHGQERTGDVGHARGRQRGRRAHGGQSARASAKQDDGRTDPHFRWTFRWKLAQLLRKLDGLDAELAELDRKAETDMEPHLELIERLCTIPGIEKITARVLIAELGTDMSQFSDAAHAASWEGLCPGNVESAGKRFSGKTRKGDRYLQRIPVQSA